MSGERSPPAGIGHLKLDVAIEGDAAIDPDRSGALNDKQIAGDAVIGRFGMRADADHAALNESTERLPQFRANDAGVVVRDRDVICVYYGALIDSRKANAEV